MAEPTASPARSQSRGRDTLQSFGRGGAGNFRQSSASRDGRPSEADLGAPCGGGEFSPVRGREPAVAYPASGVISTGRGGAGNIRSPSRDAESPSRRVSESREREILAQHAEQDKTAFHSTGRGGVGNISRSRSRGPSPLVPPGPPAVTSSGRGGLGNFTPGHVDTRIVEEEERKQHAIPDAVHSSGRGGFANITHQADPGVEHQPGTASPLGPGTPHRSGRGGAGNFRSPSTSAGREASSERGPGSRSASKEPGGLAGLWNKVTGHGPSA
ncbi:hypothetical protein BDV98DRAFT_574578 [Pterulicium gracile]|uniref:Uncharacterized protein n=1 Tax=Pterulicium gracile TaxID=1884261 RepID=A0A5C3Q689_9AGAR|nr:hypothetical protein BDV98DRAFT_574578 [Pterula gracilis]